LLAGLPFRSAVLPQRAGFPAAHPADHLAGDARRHGAGRCAELAADARWHLADARHDARRHHRTLPDRRGIAAFGGPGDGAPGAAPVPGDVPRRTAVLALAEEGGALAQRLSEPGRQGYIASYIEDA